MMALLVDTRHVVEYSNVYAITQVAMSLGFALGKINVLCYMQRKFIKCM